MSLIKDRLKFSIFANEQRMGGVCGWGGGNNVNLHFRKLRRKAEFISEKKPFTENRLEIVRKFLSKIDRVGKSK